MLNVLEHEIYFYISDVDLFLEYKIGMNFEINTIFFPENYFFVRSYMFYPWLVCGMFELFRFLKNCKLGH